MYFLLVLQQLAGNIQEAYGDGNGPKPFSNVASPVCLAIAIAYLVFGAIIFDANPIFRPGTASKSLVEQQSRSNKKLRYYVPRAKDSWTAIQTFSILGLFASFMVIVWCNNHSTVECDDNGYCQEVASEYSDSGMEVLCLYFSLFWAAILVVIFHRLGTEVFSGGSSNFLTGMFSGGLIMLGCFFSGASSSLPPLRQDVELFHTNVIYLLNFFDPILTYHLYSHPFIIISLYDLIQSYL